jgi:nitroimidazol reductase NimA-like FMN-containing flavoprotein (pyridoxamine 5'-phosphate oxidase superfamily)
MPKSSGELERFMSRPLLAAIGTIDSENKPHVVPVHFVYDDGKAFVQTGRQSVKVRNLLRNPQATLAVFEEYEAVIIRGPVKILEHEEFVKRTEDYINKYQISLDKEGRDPTGIPLYDSSLRCVLEISPNRLLFW